MLIYMNSENYIEFCNNNSGIYGLWIKSPLSGQNSLKVSVLNDMNCEKVCRLGSNLTKILLLLDIKRF